MNKALFPDLVVNGETVPQAVIATETQNHTAPSGKPGIAWRKAARAVAVRTLLLQEARRRGLRADPAEIGPGRYETDEEALIRGLLDQAVEMSPPAEEAVHTEWARDPERFRAPPLWEVSHILCACDPRDAKARDQAEVRAKTLAKQARANPRGFGKLAGEHSDCGSKAANGTLGQLGPGDTVPEFEAALRQMEEGEISAAPVLTRHGWHIIRMDAVAPGAVLPFETVQAKIAEAMEKAAWARAARGFVDKLVQNAEITGADLKPV